MSHAIRRLYEHRKSISTKPFNARGKKVVRCENCQVSMLNCICQYKRSTSSQAAFLILMHDAEVLKPSNTARLIADVVPDTYAYIWSRTEANANLLALLSDDTFVPVIVFPSQYAAEQQSVYENELPLPIQQGKKPLFILLDGSWREAKKMFRKSPYLEKFPVVSFSETGESTRENYIREAVLENQLATAQVASRMLALLGEQISAQHLSLWFDLFNYQYQKSVCQPNLGRGDALKRYLSFIEKVY
ncbi:DTW domain-containing protein [Thalassotalea sp. M1531]|uniref:tRNA-uridine aminocarboxypropyltransferase n=1 Tax=Thalassotalea algicola TaxID=2716224 RepID=A0A7Y0Q8J0_9GAMM|nr:DTW domain-containing protein [Thalassotalea algicola]NMP33276.1 DTW domain-containing protein [Thalassotalea algicola]